MTLHIPPSTGSAHSFGGIRKMENLYHPLWRRIWIRGAAPTSHWWGFSCLL